MDVALSQSIVNTAATMASSKTADAVHVAVLKKALDTQAASAVTMLQALQTPAPQLATSGTLGTQVNTFA